MPDGVLCLTNADTGQPVVLNTAQIARYEMIPAQPGLGLRRGAFAKRGIHYTGGGPNGGSVKVRESLDEISEMLVTLGVNGSSAVRLAVFERAKKSKGAEPPGVV